MLVYYLIPFIVLILGSVTKLKNKNSKLIFVCLLFVVLFFFMGFRSPTIGTDVWTYISMFQKLSSGKFSSPVFSNKGMYLYTTYNILLSYISTNEQTILIGNAFIICFLLCLFLYRLCSKHIVLSAFFYVELYFYFTSFNISRQFIAVLLVANSLYYIINNDGKIGSKIKFLIFCIAAFFVHNTSVFSFLLFPIMFIKEKQYFKYIVLLMIGFVLANLFLENIVARFFPDYYTYFEDNSIFNMDNSTTNGRMAFVYAVYLFVIIIEFYFYKKKFFHDKGMEFMILISLFSAVISFMFVKSSLISRVVIYFQIPIVYLLPYFSKCFEKKYRIVAIVALIAILFVPFYIRVSGNYSGIIEYKFFWE